MIKTIVFLINIPIVAFVAGYVFGILTKWS